MKLVVNKSIVVVRIALIKIYLVFNVIVLINDNKKYILN